MDKEKTAIERLRLASDMSIRLYKKSLIVTTSGGKDSSVCVALAQRAGIPFEVMHNHTTTDAPETVYFVRSELKRLENLGIKCEVTFPTYRGISVSMWSLIPMKLFPPSRRKRYCCEIFKERGGEGRYIATGVRWAESKKRQKGRGIYEVSHRDEKKRIILKNDNDDQRRLFETCTIQRKRVCNPIVDWTDAEVWDYLTSEKIPVNPLYKCGFDRVGCIGCPLANTDIRQTEFMLYPQYKGLYISAFSRMLMERRRRRADGSLTTELLIYDDPQITAEDVFHLWLGDIIPGQMRFDDLEDDV